MEPSRDSGRKFRVDTPRVSVEGSDIRYVPVSSKVSPDWKEFVVTLACGSTAPARLKYDATCCRPTTVPSIQIHGILHNSFGPMRASLASGWLALAKMARLISHRKV